MHEVQLFISHIDQLGPVDTALSYLDEKERQRFLNYKDEKARTLFGHARRMMKIILATRLNREPRDIHFSYSDHGKPFLRQQLKMHFNLSYSDSIICFGLATVPLGVDVELREPTEYLDAAQTVFSPEEVAKLKQVREIERSELFYSYWTRKEAFIKCQGYGNSIPIPLTKVDIRSETVQLDIPIPVGSQWDHTYTIRSFTPQAGYSGAVVVRAPSCTVELEAWA